MKRCQRCKVPLEGALSKFLKMTLKVRASDKNPALCNYCASKAKTESYTCQICDRTMDESLALAHVKAEEYLLNLIKKDHPEWKEEKKTCHSCLNYYRELIKKTNI